MGLLGDWYGAEAWTDRVVVCLCDLGKEEKLKARLKMGHKVIEVDGVTSGEPESELGLENEHENEGQVLRGDTQSTVTLKIGISRLR